MPHNIEKYIEELKPRVINYTMSADVEDVIKQIMNKFWESFEPAVREKFIAVHNHAIEEAERVIVEERLIERLDRRIFKQAIKKLKI